MPSTPLAGTVIDSRLVDPGFLFVALKGARYDGHDFIPKAVAGGAVAVLADRIPPEATGLTRLAPDLQVCKLDQATCLVVSDSLTGLQRAAAHWRRQLDIDVIGITGSVGKTTSKEIIAAVVSQRYRTLKSEGNYNNEIGLPLTLLRLNSRHERAVLEMGMYDLGEISHLAAIALPRIGVVANVGPTHLERLGTIERIAQAKAELPRALPAAGEGGVAILNMDDDRVREMAAQTRARVLMYGLDPGADLWADDIESEGLGGIRFRFHYQQAAVYAHVPMLGRHSVHTALRAAAVGLVEGLSWEEIMAGLHDQSAQLRLVAVPGPLGSIILDDTYNSSPSSCIAALNLMEELEGRKICVLGDMYELGDYTEEGHRVVGRRARDVADLLVTVGSMGRTIGEEAIEVGMPTHSVFLVETNALAIDTVNSLIKAGSGGDRILIKGSQGLHMDEIVAALTQPRGTGSTLSKDGQP